MSVRRALVFDTSRRQSCREAAIAASRLPRASRSGADAKRTPFNLTAPLKPTDQTASISLCKIPLFAQMSVRHALGFDTSKSTYRRSFGL